jgi:hypothetical protein
MTFHFQVGQRVVEKVSGRTGQVTKSGTIFEDDRPYVFYEFNGRTAALRVRPMKTS